MSRRYDKVRPILASYINCLVVHDKTWMCLDFLTGLGRSQEYLVLIDESFYELCKILGEETGLLVMIVMNYFVFTSSQLSTP